MTDIGDELDAEVEMHLGLVYGARKWRVDSGGTLVSPMQTGYEWHGGDNKAECAREGLFGNKYSHRDCSCGFYSYERLTSNSMALGGGRHEIFGVIATWGRLYKGHYGQRSEYAKVVALLRPAGAFVTPIDTTPRYAPWRYRKFTCPVFSANKMFHNLDGLYADVCPECTCVDWLRGQGYDITPGKVSDKKIRGAFATASDVDFAKLKSNYPNVKLFDSPSAMLNEYGISYRDIH